MAHILTQVDSSLRLEAFRASFDYFLGPLRPLFQDPAISEIMVNGKDRIYIERGGRVEKTSLSFAKDSDLRAAALNIAQFVGKVLDEESPIADGRLADGSRVCVVLCPVATEGTSINIRRFSKQAANPEFLIERGALTPEAAEFLSLVVRAHRNILVSGGTGSGKTTFLNVLSSWFDDRERIVSIEDTRELQIPREHVVYLEGRPANQEGRGGITIRSLFVTSLRMRPDRIVVGEVRRGEAIDLIQAMTSGHRGSLATLHADSTLDACHRLETMALMAELGLPLRALRQQVASALDVIVQTLRFPSGRRAVFQISEVQYNASDDLYMITDIFRFDGDPKSGKLAWTGVQPQLADGLEAALGEENVHLCRHILGMKGDGDGKK